VSPEAPKSFQRKAFQRVIVKWEAKSSKDGTEGKKINRRLGGEKNVGRGEGRKAMPGRST